MPAHTDDDNSDDSERCGKFSRVSCDIGVALTRGGRGAKAFWAMESCKQAAHKKRGFIIIFPFVLHELFFLSVFSVDCRTDKSIK